MYAIIETGGKQYKVQNGDQLRVEKLNAEAGSTVVFDKVLAAGEGSDIKVGAPYLEGLTVEGTVVESGKGDKVRRTTERSRVTDSRTHWLRSHL